MGSLVEVIERPSCHSIAIRARMRRMIFIWIIFGQVLPLRGALFGRRGTTILPVVRSEVTMNTETTSSTKKEQTHLRRRRLGAPRAGFAGPGHTAVEVIASDALVETDPFVLLMDDRLDFAPGQRVGGAHPHAGLETVTFVLDGALDDRDEGVLHAGDVAWMTAGRGVIHSEEVRATGRTRILQLWVTLPESARAAEPRVQILRGADMPVYRAPGVEARLYSGQSNGLASRTENHVPVTLVDVSLSPGAVFEQELPPSYNGFFLPVSGSVFVNDEGAPLREGEIGWLDRRDERSVRHLRVRAAEKARVLLYAGARQDEATIHYGPFVAGGAPAIEQMYRDFRAGRFTKLSEL
jgi:redox-sensitive bicupin YhaK (pirin superfamily)